MESEGRTPWKLVAILICTGIVSSFQVGKVPGAIPVFRENFGISLLTASWIISLLTIIGAGAGVVLGALGDRIGYRRLIRFGLSLLILGCVLGGAAPRIDILFFARFIEGIGFFFTVLSAPSLITRIVHPKHLRLILGIWGAYMPTGVALMVFVSPSVMNTVGWRGLWYLNGLICLSILILFLMSTRNLSNETARLMRKQVNIQRNVIKTVSSTGPLLLALCFLCYAGQWMALVNFLPTFFIEALDSDKGSAAIFTALAVVSNIPGNIAGGWLSQRNIPRWMLLFFAFTVSALSTFGIYSSGTTQSTRLVLLLLFSLIGGIIPGTLLASVPFHTPGKECLATTNGFITQGSNLGTLIIPPVLAVVVGAAGGWNGAPWLFAAAGSIGLLASLGIWKLETTRITREVRGVRQGD